MQEFHIRVCRRPVQTVTLKIYAEDLAEAVSKAIRAAPNADFSGSTIDYEYEGDAIRQSEEDSVCCECDNTQKGNDTVCHWCWKRGRRKPGDPFPPKDDTDA